MKIIRLFLLVLTSVIAFCNAPLVGNGTGTDAGEGKVLCGKVDYKNGAVCNANVFLHSLYLKDQSTNIDPLLTLTDAQGIYKFSNIPVGNYVIEVRVGDTLASMQYSCVGSEDSVSAKTMTLSSPVSVSATLVKDNEPLSNANIIIKGLNCVATSSANGQFSFFNLPQGDYVFLVTPEYETSHSEHVFSLGNDGDSLFVKNTPYTVLENFDDFDNRNRIGRILGDGWWYVFVDDYEGITSTTSFNPPLSDGLGAAITQENSFDAYCFHAKFLIDPESPNGFALIGTDISGGVEQANQGRTFFDLSPMTTLSFWAKGTGTIYVQFRSRLKDGTITNFNVPVSLFGEWHNHILTKDNIPLTEINGEFFSWDEGALAVKSISFMAENDAELWLDQIVIEGMNISDFFDAAKKIN